MHMMIAGLIDPDHIHLVHLLSGTDAAAREASSQWFTQAALLITSKRLAHTEDVTLQQL